MNKYDTQSLLIMRKRKNNMAAKRRITAVVLVLISLFGIASIVYASLDDETNRLLGRQGREEEELFIPHPNGVEIIFANSTESQGIGSESRQSTEPSHEEEYQPEINQHTYPAPYELFTAYSLPHTHPSSFTNFSTYTRIQGSLYPIHFGMPENYSSLGVTTFRGNNFRNSATWGIATITQERLAIRYQIGVGRMERSTTITCAQANCTTQNCTQEHRRTVRWTGVGWPGQPAIVQWDPEVQQMMNLHPNMQDKEGLVEVIYGALDGFIYFFELETGQETRPRINVGEPAKGSVSVDPRGYPILFVGQGDLMRGDRFGKYVFSLIDGSELFFLNGRDQFSMRMWGAFDGTPLIDAANDRMILIGENGIVYSMELNTVFDRSLRTVSIDPVISRYRYTGSRVLGTENSPVGFSHYLFFADNSGLIQCLDLRTLEPVWLFNAGDDTDATIVAEWEEHHQRLVLYTATSVDLQGHGGSAHIRKLNAANGDLLWEYSVRAHFNPAFNGGVLATPVLGKHDIDNLVIFWVAQVIGRNGGGALIAFDKETGEIVWETNLPVFGWSSPVAVYTDDGTSYLVVSDAQGDMRLIRGTTGEVLDRIRLGSNVEASPAVFGNFLVVGTRGERIFGIEIF